MEKIADACKEAQLPNPQFIKRSGGILVELSRTADELGNTKETILNVMKDNPKVSGIQLTEKLGVSTTAVEKNIKQLREDGRIKRAGGTRGHWEVVD